MKKILISVAFIIALSVNASASEIHVYAAASLTDALSEIGQQYQKETGDQMIFNFAASSVLAIQIQEGAPADIFFSADEAKMNILEKKKLIVPETRKSLLSNTLVIVVPEDSKLKLSTAKDLVNVKGYIAIAEPKTVPAGIYAKEYLNKIGIWSKVIDHLVPTENVRAALLAVELGNAEAGIVYKSDAEISKRTKVTFEIPLEEGPIITYPVAVVSGSKDIEAAKKALSYIESDAALAIFKKYKFLVQ
jgi:molybdate transport system substrate-binding protein